MSFPITGDTEASTPSPLLKLGSSIPLWGSDVRGNPLTSGPLSAKLPFFLRLVQGLINPEQVDPHSVLEPLCPPATLFLFR